MVARAPLVGEPAAVKRSHSERKRRGRNAAEPERRRNSRTHAHGSRRWRPRRLSRGHPDRRQNGLLGYAQQQRRKVRGGGLMFDYSQPCPPSESVDLPINTTSLPNGQHTLKVLVQDAAGNSAVVYDGSISTKQPASGSLGAQPGPGTGGAAAGGAGSPNGTTASRTATLTVGLKTKNTRTGPNGTFIAAVPGGPTRTIEVAYRAFSAEAGYAAEAKIVERVGAGVKLTIVPRATGSEGAIRLAGKVLGPVPTGGVVVELLVHYRGHWEPFRAPRTDSRGRFQVVYQFQGGLGRFPFKAMVFGGQGSFPFTDGESRTVDVTTR